MPASFCAEVASTMAGGTSDSAFMYDVYLQNKSDDDWNFLEPECRIPVGFGFWDAAHALAAFLYERKSYLRDLAASWNARRAGEVGRGGSAGGPSKDPLRVLELGCGACPLPSFVTARILRGHQQVGVDVVAADYEQGVLDLARGNAELNGFLPAEVRLVRYAFGDVEDPVAPGLDAGAGLNAVAEDEGAVGRGAAEDGGSSSVVAEAEEAGAAAVDGREQVLARAPYDVILGADIAYVPRPVQKQLRNSLAALSSRSDGGSGGRQTLLFLAHTCRDKEGETRFLRQLVELDGWDLLEVCKDLTPKRHEIYGRVAHNAQKGMMGADIYVFVLRKVG
eukprot:g2555.t1